MLDAETRDFLDRARDRRQVELSVRLIETTPRSRPWEDTRAIIVAAIEARAAEGLRVLRAERTRPGLILTGPAGAWRTFLQDHRKLANDPALEFRRHIKPWSHGLPGMPE